VNRAGRPALIGAAAVSYVIAAAALCQAVDVQVTTVRALEHGPSDAQLVALRPRLRRLVGYRSFQVIGQEKRRCAWQEREARQDVAGRQDGARRVV